jgi:hypothetical protein
MHEHKLSREEFEREYRHYMDSNGYMYDPSWEVTSEWTRYARGRSWFIPYFHGERALAVITELTGEVF